MALVPVTAAAAGDLDNELWDMHVANAWQDQGVDNVILETKNLCECRVCWKLGHLCWTLFVL